jgi:hypothetical protein
MSERRLFVYSHSEISETSESNQVVRSFEKKKMEARG